jgi:hypothetical protein
MWPSSGVSKSPSPWFFRMLNSTWVESHLRVFSLHTPLVHERRDANSWLPHTAHHKPPHAPIAH